MHLFINFDMKFEVPNRSQLILESTYEVRNGTTSVLAFVDFHKLLCVNIFDLNMDTVLESLGAFRAPCSVGECFAISEIISEGASWLYRYHLFMVTDNYYINRCRS